MNPTPGMLINPRVRILRLLGEGSMGTVWVGEHLTLQTEVAVKFISADLEHEDPQVLERFQREARAAAQIKSPNVVQMLDHGVTNSGAPYIVMELLVGQSLMDHLDTHGPMGMHETAMVITQVARALAKAHALGIVHRDVKPQNIFLLEEDEETSEVEDQQVKVLDFGIAKRVEVPRELTVPGMVIGTPGYMCPDQVLDSIEASPLTDCWSLAVVAYQTLTCELPFYGETLGQLVGALIRGEFKPVSEVREELSPALDPFFARAFAKNTADRFASAVELATAFREAVGIPAPGSSGRWGLPSRASIGQTVDSPLAAPVVTDDANVPVREDGVSIEPEDAGAPPIAPPRRAGLIGVAVAGGLLVGAAMVMLLRGMVDSPNPTQSTTKIAPPAPTAPVGALLEIAGGTYDLGCNPTDKSDCDKSTMPPRSVVLSAYKIDRTEVTVARYRECVKDDDCTVDGLTDDPLLCNWTDQSRNDHPVNCVSWSQAQAYCEWAGGSLPTEAQWEHAARDKERRRFPWGDEPATCRHAVLADDQGDGCGRKQTWHVGSKPQGASRSQALDMAGNVREWVADWWSPRVAPDLGRNPPGPKWGTDRVVRGGGWRDEPDALRTYHRSYMNPDVRSPDLGFRCVRKVER